MKFVMFPSGLAVFSSAIDHKKIYLCGVDEQNERPVAAGICFFVVGEDTIESISFEGRSSSLGLDANSIYLDWKERFLHSELTPYVMSCGVIYGKAFLFPFNKISRFGLYGSREEGFCNSSPAELVEAIESGWY